LANHEAFERQAIHHPGNGGPIIGDQSGQSCLINPRAGGNRGERRILHRRQVKSGSLDLRMEHRYRDLLETAGQVPGFVDVFGHLSPIG
jgi:hypothetical protein